MISPLGNRLSSLKFEDKDIEKVYFEDKIVYRKNNKIYTPVTAIVASTTDQWVDTGLGKDWWTDKIEFETKAMFSEHSAAVLGQRAAEKILHYDLILSQDLTLQLRNRNDSGKNTIITSNKLNYNEPIIVSYHSDSELFVNNIKATPSSDWISINNRIFMLQDSFHLFRINQFMGQTAGSGGFNDNGTRTIYYIKMWYDGKLKMNYIPVLDENGVPCFFDKVSQNFFYSAGPQPLEYIE